MIPSNNAAWSGGQAFEGEEDWHIVDATTGRNLTYKSNHHSLVREVTYDPRLGMLYSHPVEELSLLRTRVLAHLDSPAAVPPGGVVPLPTPPLLANQSEVRVSFAMPSNAVTLGVRVMTKPDCVPAVGRPCPPRNRTMWSAGMGFSVAIVAPPNTAAAAAWGVTAGADPDRATHAPVGFYAGIMPLLRTEKHINMTLYVDQTFVECFFNNGRYSLAVPVPVSLMAPGGGNTLQGVEIFASGQGVNVLSATVWQMSDTWPDIKTHGRPNHKANQETETVMV